MSVAENSPASRSEEILTVAQNFIQSRGYNGFSYRDIAAKIGVKSASVHYHFPTKGELGQAVTARYTQQFGQQLLLIEGSRETARDRLKDYAKLFQKTLVERDLLCMCGMLAGDMQTLPDVIQAEVVKFFEAQQQWLANVIQIGIETGEIPASVNPKSWATTFLATLEGAMLVSRGLAQNDQFDVVTESILETLKKP